MLLLSIHAFAEPPKPPLEMRLEEYSLQMRDYSFPSGLRIVFQEDHSQPIVAITTTVDRGSSSDPVGLEGIAHCVEHMWFRSVHKDPSGKDLPKVWDILKEMGANLNASTADDWTNYMTVASREQLVPLLRLESLRMAGAVQGVSDDDLRVEREVIRNELRLRYENSWMSSLGSIFAALYPSGHPYARMGIGTHASLDAITLADVQAFAREHYRPENTTITVVGDFELYDTPQLVAEFRLDQIAAPDDPRGERIALVPPKIRVDVSAAAPEPPEPVLPVEVKGEVVNLQHQPGAVDKRLLVLAWATPGAYHSSDFTAEVAAYFLRYAILQELYPSWEYTRAEPPAALESLGCFPWQSKVTSKVLCALELADDDDAARMTERALNGLYRMWVGDEVSRRFQDWFFHRVQTERKAAIFASVDNVASLTGRATEVSAWTHFTGDPRYFATSFEQLATVSGDAVRAFAERYLVRQRAVATVVEPYEEGQVDVTASTTQWRGARRGDSFDSILTEAQAEARVRAATVAPDRAKIQVTKLENGVELVTMPHSQSPLVQVAVRFATGGGVSAERLGHLAWAAAMTREDSAVDPLQFAGLAEDVLDDRSWTFQVAAPAGNLADATYVLRHRLDRMIAWMDGRADWVKSEKRAVLAWMREPGAWAERVGAERLLPGHPASAWLDHGEIDALARLGAPQISATLAELLRPANARIFVVGNVAPAEAEEVARTWFGDWAGWGPEPAGWSPPAADWAPMPAPPARQVLLFDRDDVSQTVVDWACPVSAPDEAGEVRARVLSLVLDDGAWLALREHTGSSYGAGAWADLRGGLGILRMSVQVQNDQAAAAVAAFDDLARKARAGRIDGRVVAMQKLAHAQSYVLGHSSTRQMLDRLMAVPGEGAARFDRFTRFADTLAAVRTEELPAVLEPCVGHEVVTLVGPVAVLEPQFAAAGIPAEVFDWKAATQDYRLAMGLKPEKQDRPKKAGR